MNLNVFKKGLVALTVSAVLGASAVAGPAVAKKGGTAIDNVIEGGKKPGETEEQARKRAEDALSKKYSKDIVDRLMKGDPTLSVELQRAGADLLKGKEFKPTAGLKGRVENKGNEKTDAVIEGLADKPANDNGQVLVGLDGGKGKENAEQKKAEQEKARKEAEHKEAVATATTRSIEQNAKVAKNISTKAAKAIADFAANGDKTRAHLDHFVLLEKVANKLQARVAKGQIDAHIAEQMIMDIAKSPERMDGAIIVGEGAAEGCMGMAKEAVENLGEFIHGGEIANAKHAKEYVEGMLDAVAKKFPKENASASRKAAMERLDALTEKDEQGTGCKLLSPAFRKALMSLQQAA